MRGELKSKFRSETSISEYRLFIRTKIQGRWIGESECLDQVVLHIRRVRVSEMERRNGYEANIGEETPH